MNMFDLKACNTHFTVKVYIGDAKPCAANQAMLFLLMLVERYVLYLHMYTRLGANSKSQHYKRLCVIH